MPTISGVTLDSLGNPVARFVTVQNRATLAYVAKGNSNAVTGAFSVTTPDYSEHVVIAYAEATMGYIDPSPAATALSLPFDGANGSTVFTDASPHAFAVARKAGTGTISTAIPPVGGTACAHFDGGTYLSLPTASALTLTGAFTVETWVNLVSLSDCHVLYGPGNIQFRVISGSVTSYGGGVQISGVAPGFSTNTWAHLAWVRDASNLLTIFFNGTSIASGTSAGTYDLSGGRIGGGNGTYVNGYLDTLRIKNGVVMYTGTFAPPTSFLEGVLIDGGSADNAEVYDRVIPV